LAVCRLGDAGAERPNVVAAESGDRTTPAVVANVNGEWVLGEAAKQQETKNPKNTFKQLLNRAAKDGAAKLQPVDGAGNAVGEAVEPGALLSMLLRRLKETAEENVGGKVGPCVLAVPCDFTPDEREAVAAAGRAAGLDVLQVLAEPTAAALACGVADAPGATEASGRKVVAVVDLGGSSLAVTVLVAVRGVMTITAHESTAELSGDILVEKLALFAAQAFSRKCGADPLEGKKSAAKLRLVCEGTLRFLSNAQQADIEAESLCEGMDLRQRVSRARFEDLAGDQWPLLDKTLAAALAAAGSSHADVDQVLLVGGAARVPKLLSRLGSSGLSDASLVRALAVPPDEASALGAAAQAARLVCGPAGSDPARDYKKSKGKLHKRVPAEAASLACLESGLALRVGGAVFTLAAAGCALPARLRVPVPAGAAVAGGGGSCAVELVELAAGGEADLVATLTMQGLTGAPALLATMSVSAEGEVALKVGALLNAADAEKTSHDVEVTIPAP